MKVVFFFSVGWLLVTSAAAPTALPNSTLSGYYIDVTAEEHQANFEIYKAAGYRIGSLSVYGQPPDTRYAALWQQQSGPTQVEIHEANSTTYETWFNQYYAEGYISTQISVTGPSGAPLYAGVMEQSGNVTNWYQKCGMDGNATQGEFYTGKNNKLQLASLSGYGSTVDRRWCGIWLPNDQFDKYTFSNAQDSAYYELTKLEQTSKPFWRPSYQSISDDGQITVLFTDTYVGNWVAKHGMNASSLQEEIEIQKAAGLSITQLDAAGAEANTQFAAIFTQHEVSPRTWRSVGSSSGFVNNTGAEEAADSFMETWMKKYGVRQAQLSAGINGSIILTKAYSWSEESRPTTQPEDRFLLASLSKMFLAAAIQNLYDVGVLTPDTKVYPLLGYTDTYDMRAQNITVDNLITHFSGYDRDMSFDPAYNALLISNSLGLSAPVTAKDMVDFMSKRALDRDPGLYYTYGNYGYILLSYVVEHLTNQTYYEYLRENILEPGNYDVQKWGSFAADHESDRVIQESSNTGINVLNLPRTPYERIASIYGGDGMVKENSYGTVSLATSADTLVRFISQHAVWGIGKRPTFVYEDTSSGRLGTTDGASTCAQSRGDGVDWAVTVNTRDWPAFPQYQDPVEYELCGLVINRWLDQWDTI